MIATTAMSESVPCDNLAQGLDHSDPGQIPGELLCVPGFIEEVMAYTLQTAPYPDRALAFGGALALQSVLAGRKVRDEMDNRTNLFLLALANSGAGKDYPRKVNQKVLCEMGLTSAIGDTFASGEGIEDRLYDTPAILFQTDEIDGLMTKINQGTDARHEGIMNTLLRLYTSAGSVFALRAKAGQPAKIIYQPCLCIFGTAVPKHYYEALTPKMLTNGFLARNLTLETGKRGKGQDAIIRNLPQTVLERATWWAKLSLAEGHQDRTIPQPLIVKHTPEAGQIFRDFRALAEAEYSLAEDRVDQAGMAIWSRAHEKALRLGLIYACSAEQMNLSITADAARWACRFAEHQTRRMLFMASAHVSESDFDARCKELFATLHKWADQHGQEWMPFWKINRLHNWPLREHEDVRQSLLNQHLIEYSELTTGGRPSRMYRVPPSEASGKKSLLSVQEVPGTLQEVKKGAKSYASKLGTNMGDEASDGTS